MRKKIKLAKTPIQPKYAQVKGSLMAAIRGKRINPGDKLPSEAQLMAEFKVSRITVRRALADLIKDGILCKKNGMAHLVQSSVPAPYIGLIYGNDVAGPDDVPFFRQIIQHIRSFLAEQCFSLRFYCVRSTTAPPNSDREQLMLDIRRGVLTGVIALAWPCGVGNLENSAMDQELLEMIRAAALPLAGVTSADFPGAISLDYHALAYSGTVAFLDRNINEVGLVYGADKLEDKNILAGYRQALDERNLPFKPEWVCGSSNLHVAGGYAACRRLAALPHRPRAVVVTDDLLCQGLVIGAMELDVNIPADLLVASLFIKSCSTFSLVPLVRLEIDPALIGRQVTELIVAQIRNPNVVQERLWIRPKVVEIVEEALAMEKASLDELLIMPVV